MAPDALPLRFLRPLDVASPPAGRPPFIASGSGLEVAGAWMYVAVDDDVRFGAFSTTGCEPGHLVHALPGELPADPEALAEGKPDLETVCVAHPEHGTDGCVLVGLPSGSGAQRHRGFTHTLDRGGSLVGTPAPVECAELFAALAADITDSVNVEGAVALHGHLLLFLRSTAGTNHIARFSLAAAREDMNAGVLSARGLEGIDLCELGELDGTPLGFSDAAVAGDRVLVAGSAEAAGTARSDGSVVGSVIATLVDGRSVTGMHPVAAREKVEGLAVVDTVGSELVLWAVTDDDAPDQPSRLFELRYPA